MFVAWRDLRFARGRFALIGAVVGMLSVLVGFLSGLTGGLAYQNVSGVLALPGDRIVFSSSAPGATPGFSDSAVTEEQARSWSHAASISALGVSQVRAQTDDARVAVAVFGLDDSPLSPEPGFITLSVAAAQQLGVESGQDVSIAGQTFTVAEVSGDARSSVQLRMGALTVIEAHGVAGVTLCASHGHDSRRVQAAGQQDNRTFFSSVQVISHFSAPARHSKDIYAAAVADALGDCPPLPNQPGPEHSGHGDWVRTVPRRPVDPDHTGSVWRQPSRSPPGNR